MNMEANECRCFDVNKKEKIGKGKGKERKKWKKKIVFENVENGEVCE
jgi:hypothetical protein